MQPPSSFACIGVNGRMNAGRMTGAGRTSPFLMAALRGFSSSFSLGEREECSISFANKPAMAGSKVKSKEVVEWPHDRPSGVFLSSCMNTRTRTRQLARVICF